MGMKPRPSSSRQLKRQWRAFKLLGEGWWTANDLAKALGVNKSTAARDIDALASVFYIEQAHTDDHEQRLIFRRKNEEL